MPADPLGAHSSSASLRPACGRLVSHSGVRSLIPSSPAARQGSVRLCSALVTPSPDRSGPAHSFPTLRFCPGYEMYNRLRSGEHTLPHSGPPCGCAPRFAVVLVLGPVLIRRVSSPPLRILYRPRTAGPSALQPERSCPLAKGLRSSPYKRDGQIRPSLDLAADPGIG